MIIAWIELDELPKDCGDCPLCYDDMYCMAVDMPKCKGIRYGGERPDWCPMIDVTYPVMVHMKRLAELFAKTLAKLKEENHEEE